MSEENEFRDLFEKTQVNMSIKKGDKVSGPVVAIDKKYVFVDLGGRQDGVLDRKDFLDEQGELTVQKGDVVEAYVAGSDADGILLRRQLGGRDVREVDQAVAEAFQSKIPVEGKVTAVRRKEEKLVGYTVQVGKSEAFCPASQMDARGIRREPEEYVGQTYPFRVTEYAEDGWWFPAVWSWRSRRRPPASVSWPIFKRGRCSPARWPPSSPMAPSWIWAGWMGWCPAVSSPGTGGCAPRMW